jgi:solute carrier family 25 S-adenosylmethionine transporter 26
VDLVLFPLDTIKTRIQATLNGKSYIEKAKNVSKFSGLKAQIFASFPSAAAFFSTYDFTKYILFEKIGILKKYETFVHMTAAVIGEASAVLVRNPFELIKQNMQIGKYQSVKEAFRNILDNQGVKGLYRGYFITVLREIPFGIIQYPLYEKLKKNRQIRKNKLTTFDCCLSGAIAGGFAAFVTTPLDVIKTRIMTYEDFVFSKLKNVIRTIYLNEGSRVFFFGVKVRVLYISLGGTIFFGTNEFSKRILGFENVSN